MFWRPRSWPECEHLTSVKPKALRFLLLNYVCSEWFEGWTPSTLAGCVMNPIMAMRPEGANHQRRKNPPGELSIDPVADWRLVGNRMGWSLVTKPPYPLTDPREFDIVRPLDVEEGYMKVADKSIGRGHALLQHRALRPKQRAKVEEQLRGTSNFFIARNWSTGKRTQGIQRWWQR